MNTNNNKINNILTIEFDIYIGSQISLLLKIAIHIWKFDPAECEFFMFYAITFKTEKKTYITSAMNY